MGMFRLIGNIQVYHGVYQRRFLSCSLAKTWNSYTYLECDKRYEFNQDSIVFVDSTQANQGLEFYLACENSFGDEFPVYDSLGRIVDWEYGKYTFKDYMLFFEYAESNRDSLWISSFYENNVIDTIEIKRRLCYNGTVKIIMR